MTVRTSLIVVCIAILLTAALTAAIMSGESQSVRDDLKHVQHDVEELRARVEHVESRSQSTTIASAHPTTSAIAPATSAPAPKTSGWWCYKQRCQPTLGECDAQRNTDIFIDPNARSRSEYTLVRNSATGGLERLAWTELPGGLASGTYTLSKESTGVQYDRDRPDCEQVTAVACLEYVRVLDESKHVSCFDTMAACQRERDQLAGPDWRMTTDCKPVRR